MPDAPRSRFLPSPVAVRRALRTIGALCLSVLASGGALAQQMLPSEVDAALARARVPREAVTMLVADADAAGPPRLAWRTQVPVNPASIMKLVTTYAALDLLGPAYSWSTPVYIDGPVRSNGVLDGNLYIKGQGDPMLVLERVWLLLRQVQGLGITSVNGDIVIDRSAFDNTVDADPAAFDGEPLRPYNASPDALLVNFKAVTMNFVPVRGGQSAQVSYDPPLAGVATQATVALSPGGECGDYRAALRPDFSDPNRIRFGGSFPAACGAKSWPVAYADPRSYALRAIGGLWAEMGGRVGGKMREGRVPAGLAPAFEFGSPPLAEVIRDINKYSNNVMAQQLFLTLGLTQKGHGSFEAARAAVGQWWRERIGTGEAPPVLDNGSGLSRDGRISAAALGKLLQVAWRSPAMPELMSSLPVTGVDGTLRKRALRSGATAHLKTGTLRDAAGVAGYVDGASGRRYVVVAIANHENAPAARAAFDALVDWAARD
jgi:D-alanyl-D-alanine carboxypeptidase/D-alanyl-D-alanine-endopeptidase (penicillin-binding protein 4)